MRVQKHLILTLACIFLLALLMMGCTTTPFEAVSITCADGEHNPSAEPLFEGPGETEVTVTDEGEIFVDTVTYPTAYPDSSWVAPGQGRVNPEGGYVTHFGYGTGAFAGGLIAYEVLPLSKPFDLPCEPDGPVVQMEGVIMLPLGFFE